VAVLALLVTGACGSVGPAGDGTAAPGGAGSDGTSRAAAASTSPSPSASPSPAAPPQLPRGGTTIFPRYRVVAYYGSSASSRLGVLGEGTPEAAGRRLLKAAAPFQAAGGKPVLPAFELIVTVANRTPGPDGSYSSPVPEEGIARYVAAARKLKALVILDVQPGRGNVLTEVKRYEKWLKQPDIGLAVDPEWTMPPGKVPGRTIGTIDAYRVNQVSAYLDGLVRQYRLPQKLFVIHQFTARMVTARSSIDTRPGLATVFHIDGFGGQGIKRQVYTSLVAPPGFYNGYKLFYDEDTPMMTPRQAMSLRPRPDLITYQ